jgi:hypothetical protein
MTAIGLDESPRDWFDRVHRELVEAALAAKDSNEATVKLAKIYKMAKPEFSPEIDALIAEWLLSSDAGTRFDARALVNHFRLRSALRSLNARASQLEHELSAPSRYELKRIREFIESFETASPTRR